MTDHHWFYLRVYNDIVPYVDYKIRTSDLETAESVALEDYFDKNSECHVEEVSPETQMVPVEILAD